MNDYQLLATQTIRQRELAMCGNLLPFANEKLLAMASPLVKACFPVSDRC